MTEIFYRQYEMMFPDSVNTIVIGDEIPTPIYWTLQRNERVLYENSIPFNIIKLDRDKKFKTAGLQAEYKKIEILSQRCNVVVCDWDVLFLDTPNFICLDKCYFGYWEKSDIADMFLTWYRDFSIMEYFVGLHKELQRSMIQFPGFSRKVANELIDRGIGLRYDGPYTHLNANCGQDSFDTFSEYPVEKKQSVESRCYRKIADYGFFVGNE